MARVDAKQVNCSHPIRSFCRYSNLFNTMRPALTWLMIGALFGILTCSCSDIGPPARPTDVSAISLSQHEIYLTWNCVDEEGNDPWWYEEDSPSVSYYINRNGNYLTSVENLEFEDTDLIPDTLYCYRVSSYWDQNVFDWFIIQESGLSQEACAWTYPLNAISGTITLDGDGFAGVQVELISNLGFPAVLGTTATQSEGRYFFHDLENSSYLISPVQESYVFSPQQWQVDLVNQDATGINFTAYDFP